MKNMWRREKRGQERGNISMKMQYISVVVQSVEGAW